MFKDAWCECLHSLHKVDTIYGTEPLFIKLNSIQLDDSSNPPISKFNQLSPKIFEEAHDFNLIKNHTYHKNGKNKNNDKDELGLVRLSDDFPDLDDDLSSIFENVHRGN